MIVRQLTSLLRNLLNRQREERELDAEIRSNELLLADEKIRAGMSPQEAHRQARIELGGIEQVKEQVREIRAGHIVETLFRDVRFGLRMLTKNPGFTAVAVITLALSIGANTAIFSLLNAVVLRLLPVPNPQQLVQFTYTFPSSVPENWNRYFGYAQLERFREQARTLSGIFGGTQVNRVNVGWHGSAGLAQCDAYTDNLFSVLQVTPQRGRLFVPGDDREGANVAVLSDRFWRTRFAADPEIIGQTILIDQLAFTVIGIAPPEFSGIYVGAARDIWVPLHAVDRFTPDPNRWQAPFTSWLLIAGRRRPGVSLTQAEAELDVIHRRLLVEQLAVSERRDSQSMQRFVRQSHLVLHPAANGMFSGLRHTYALPLELLIGVSGIVLLISCINMANLALARASHRRPEIALRMALGSGRGRLVRQLLTECFLVASTGGSLGLAIAWWGGAVLVRMISTGDTPVPLDVRPDWRFLGFTAAVSLISGILFGLLPAISGTRVDPGLALKQGGTMGPKRALGRALVTVQVTLSLVLITGAGLFLRTLENLWHVNVGYDRENILMFSTDAKLAGYPAERTIALYRAILERTAALPGVQSASASIVRPVDDQYYLVDEIRQIDDRELPDAETIKVAWNAMSPGYFTTVGTPILMGRDFDARDSDSGLRVVTVNESLARRAFPGRNPIGHRIDDAEIIGVIQDSMYGNAREQPHPVLYRPLFQSQGGTDPDQWVGVGFVSFELRYRSNASLVNGVRQAVGSVDRNLPIFRVKTLQAQTEDSFLRERLLAAISSFFGGLALLLAGLGLYGLLAYAVARRTAEIGVRMALGAHQGGIIWLIVRETLWLVLAGVGAGIPLAILLSRYAKTLLFGIAGVEPRIFAYSVAALIGVALLAGFLPARRAMKVDPMVALRYE